MASSRLPGAGVIEESAELGALGLDGLYKEDERCGLRGRPQEVTDMDDQTVAQLPPMDLL